MHTLTSAQSQNKPCVRLDTSSVGHMFSIRLEGGNHSSVVNGAHFYEAIFSSLRKYSWELGCNPLG